MLLLWGGGRLHQDTLLWRVQPPLQTTGTMLWRMWTYVKSNSVYIPSLVSALSWLQSNKIIRLYLIGCFHNSAVLINGQSIPDPGDLCSECTCQVASAHTYSHSHSCWLISLKTVLCSFSYREVQCDVRRSRVQQPPVLTRSPVHVAALSVTVTSLWHITVDVTD